MDITKLVETLNNGGWHIEGWWNGKSWAHSVGGEIRKAEIKMVGRPWLVCEMDGNVHHHLPVSDAALIVEESPGRTGERLDRITVKGPAEGGAIKAKLVLVNPTAAEENRRSEREAFRKLPLRQQLTSMLDLLKGAVLQEVEIIDSDRITLRFTNGQALDILADSFSDGTRSSLWLEDYRLGEALGLT